MNNLPPDGTVTHVSAQIYQKQNPHFPSGTDRKAVYSPVGPKLQSLNPKKALCSTSLHYTVGEASCSVAALKTDCLAA